MNSVQINSSTSSLQRYGGTQNYDPDHPSGTHPFGRTFELIVAEDGITDGRHDIDYHGEPPDHKPCHAHKRVRVPLLLWQLGNVVSHEAVLQGRKKLKDEQESS
jgi:hypothetical protein